MAADNLSKIYRDWAPTAGRIFLGIVFLSGAYFKIPGTESFSQEVGFTAAAGIPFPKIALFLAFILETITGISMIIGWKARAVAFILVLYTIFLTLLFHFSFKTPQDIGMFVSHLGLIGGLLYASVHKK